jgi:CheY-like chemotaxis protein
LTLARVAKPEPAKRPFDVPHSTKAPTEDFVSTGFVRFYTLRAQIRVLAPSFPGEQVRVLIVDDQEFIRRGIRAALSIAPEIAVCGEASDGSEAIEKARQLNPDVVLMDISMPGLDGLDGTRELRRMLPNVQVVTVSQYDIPGMVKEALAAGAARHVSKLFIWDSLVETLRGLQSPRLCDQEAD